MRTYSIYIIYIITLLALLLLGFISLDKTAMLGDDSTGAQRIKSRSNLIDIEPAYKKDISSTSHVFVDDPIIMDLEINHVIHVNEIKHKANTDTKMLRSKSENNKIRRIMLSKKINRDKNNLKFNNSAKILPKENGAGRLVNGNTH